MTSTYITYPPLLGRGHRVTDRREELGLSLEALAERTGVPERVIALLETGRAYFRGMPGLIENYDDGSSAVGRFGSTDPQGEPTVLLEEYQAVCRELSLDWKSLSVLGPE